MRKYLLVCLAGSLILPLCSSRVLSQSDKEETSIVRSKWGDAIASTPAPSPAQRGAESSYDSRALRLESDWGRLRIRQGVDGMVVGVAGPFKTANVEKIVAGSERAETEARLFRASHRRGALSGALGLVTLGVGIAVASSNSSNAATPVFMIAGAGGMLWGARQINEAYSSLSRAVWWYNRDLPR